MDKTWMHVDRTTRKWELGVIEFLRFALSNSKHGDRIKCPCVKCVNALRFPSAVVKDHLYVNGISRCYQKWVWHGEPSRAAIGATESDIQGHVENGEEVPDQVEEPAVGESEDIFSDADETYVEMDMGAEDEELSQDSQDFMKFVEDHDKPLYPGDTRHTKLSVLIKAFQIKAKYGQTDACFSDWLQLFGICLPQENEIPRSFYDAKKALSSLGMDYHKIHACLNDCILYRGEHAKADSCPTCGETRWKLGRDKKVRKGVPKKVLWYFPPIPRFKRMFQSTETAKHMTWHEKSRGSDGLMRHPADSPTWKSIDNKWPEFGSEPRNIRLALSSDGFNPHGNLSSSYSCWPVLLVTYNLPPWLCMKRKYMMLTLLISGPKQPGNDIDVYLQPLIDDLKLLWEGIDGVYDAYRKEYFKMKALLLWTINDLPAYGNLSGCVVHGSNACPICIDKADPPYLNNYRKNVWNMTRKFLPQGNKWRRQKAAFNGKPEYGEAPLIPLTGEEVLRRTEGLNYECGKKRSRPVFRGRPGEIKPCFKKRAVFFDLEYWKDIPIRHNLDAMHIEKNCGETLIGTVMNIPDKTKDSAAVRLDMKEMGIGDGLQPLQSGRNKLPLASWNMKLEERIIVCNCFFNMKVPEGFCSNIRRLVDMKNHRLVGMKSHDYHAIMHHLLPIAIRSVMDKPVRYAITRFCLFFKAICSKAINPEQLEKMQADLVDTVCLLEKYFPPSFFTISIHLSVHLVKEVELCGPVFFRWMYPFERYMKVFKGYVRNRTYPEGCIAESYIVEEAVEFLKDRGVNSDEPANEERGCRPRSGGVIVEADEKDLELAHLCVLHNLEVARPYFEEHMELLKVAHPKHRKNQKWLKEKQNKSFAKWLKQKVAEQMKLPNHGICEELRWISNGALRYVLTFTSYEVYGVHFNTKEHDDVRTVQNSGVSLVATTMQVASAKDKNPITQELQLYGVIKDIWELDYVKIRVPLFKCDWAASDGGVKEDDLCYTQVNLNRLGFRNDPFVMAECVKQVFYIDDPSEPGWSIVVRVPDKDYRDYDNMDEEDGDFEIDFRDLLGKMPPIEESDDDDDDDDYEVGQECNKKKRTGDEEVDLDVVI